MSAASSAQTSPVQLRSTSSESWDTYRPQAQTSQSGLQPAELDRDERRGVPHITAPVQRTSSNTSHLPSSPTAVSPPADPTALQTFHSTPSSPVIVVPPDVPEAGSQVALSYFQHKDPNNSAGSMSFLTPDGSPLPSSTHSLGLSSNRASKRNSINPAMSFNYEALSREFNKKSSSAPQSPSTSQLPTIDMAQASSHADPQLLPSREQALEGLARVPSRRTRTEVPTSTPAGSMISRSRSRSELSPKPSTSTDSMGPSQRQNAMLERLPPRTHNLKSSSQDSEALTRRPSIMASATNGSLRRTSSDEKDRSKPGSSLSIDVEKSRAGYGVGKRPLSPAHKAASPAHKVDVPRGIESGTDTSDGEREPSTPSTKERPRKLSQTSKEKEAKKSRRHPVQLEFDAKQSTSQEEQGEDSFLSNAGDAFSEDESSPVERVSRSTFIAPAHPPIRFSVTENGFQELLSQFDPSDPSSLNVIEEALKLNPNAEARRSAGSSVASLHGAAPNEEGRGSSPASAATLTSIFGSSSGDNSSATTISAPSSQGHGDSFLSLDQSGTTNGAKSDLLPHQRSVRNTSSISSSRSSSDNSHDPPASDDQRARLDPNAVVYYADTCQSETTPHLTVTTPGSAFARPGKLDHSAAVMKRLQDALQDTARRGITQITLDQEFVQAVVMMIEQRRDESAKMKSKLDSIKVRPLSMIFRAYN